MKQTETGIMVMKDKKAWGKVYEDGREVNFGWLNPADSRVEIYDPQYCKKPTDVTYPDSHYKDELKKAIVVAVRRETIVTIENDKNV